MAQLITFIRFATILIWYLVQKSAFVDSGVAEGTPCTFPKGSIACKIWNYTNMDCSWRELVCIPPLRHKNKLKLLDLSNNKLSLLSQDSFCGLIKLTTLDISFNNISKINVDAFIPLTLLQTLNMSYNSLQSVPDGVFCELHNLLSLYLNDNNDFCVRNRTFTGLGKLKTLDISSTKLIFVPDSLPFQNLHSLRTLSLKVAHFLDTHLY